MGGKARAWIDKLLLLLGALTVASVVGEMLVRLCLPDPSSNHVELLTEHDPVLGWRKKANKVGMFTQPEYRVVERINSRGLRGPEYSYEKKPGVLRLMVLGDSFAEGYTVNFPDLFSEVLRDRLSLRLGGRPVEVINAGTGGYSTDQELLFFTGEGHKYRPDLVVLMFYYNDVFYNGTDRYWRGLKPFYELHGENLELRGVPVPAPAPKRRPGLKERLARVSWAYAYIRSASARSKAMRGSKPTRWTMPGESEDLGVFRNVHDAPTKKAWKVTELLLRDMERAVRSNGGGFLIFYVPSRLELHPEEWDKHARALGWTAQGWSRRAVIRELERVARKYRLDLINPLEEFGAHERGSLYFAQDPHWNEKGHRLAAEILADGILSRRFARPGAGKGRRLRP